MTRLRLALLVLLVVVLLLGWALFKRGPAPPKVPFEKVRREPLVSTLVTNGKVQPSHWSTVRAERQGLIERLYVKRGQHVAKGALVAELDSKEARTELAAAEARLAQSQAILQTLSRGGSSEAQAEIENALIRTRNDLRIAQRDYDSLKRLQEKQAATMQEVADAQQKVQQAQIEIKAFERKRVALVDQSDRAAAEAKVREAQAAVQQARETLEQGRVRAPIAGAVYDLPVRAGAYVNPGDPVASIGLLDNVNVVVYVDEPELGRVAVGKPVTITWDALPGRHWEGEVENMPTQVIALGTRQVGEVVCTIRNPGVELLPGTNINAEIQSQVVELGLTVPKEAVRREGSDTGVFVLQGNRVVWRKVKAGASSVTRSQIVSGVSEGEPVALATEVTLKNGQEVEPEYPE
jgi:HlyD family secretion protein